MQSVLLEQKILRKPITIAAMALLTSALIFGALLWRATLLTRAASADTSDVGSVAATADYFIKIDGIDGESTDSSHRNWLQVTSWQWGIGEPMDKSTPKLMDKATPKLFNSFQELQITKAYDKSSPKIFMAAVKGERIKEIVLTTRQSGTTEDYLKITMNEVMVSSYTTGGGSTDARPVESISFNYAKIKIEYKPQDPATGTPGEPVTAGWDLKKNKAM